MKNRHIQIDHNYDYVGKDFCDGANCKKDCNTVQHADIRKQRVETVGSRDEGFMSLVFCWKGYDFVSSAS